MADREDRDAGKPPAASPREARLAKALRDNLRRRKAAPRPTALQPKPEKR